MITAHQARTVLAAATLKATGLGVAANIAVLDAGAHLKAFHRMDGAVLGAIDVSIGKARTSVLFGTGYNETMADTPFRWLDDAVNFTKRDVLRAEFDAFFATPEGRMDAREQIDRMIEIVPADEGLFRNVSPKAIEDMLKAHQVAAWDNRI